MGGHMKKWVISLTTVSIIVILLSCTTVRSTTDVSRISKDELKAKLGSPGIVLIDVRTESDWRVSDEKIVGALRRDPDAVDTWSASLPKNKEIILYCA